MPRQRIHVDWKTVDGAFSKPRRLHLENDKEGLFHCPAPGCEHDGFASQRGESTSKQNIRGIYILKRSP